MQKKRIHIVLACFSFLLFSTCKKEVLKPDAFTAFGRVYPLKGNQNIVGASKTPDGGYLFWGSTDKGSHGRQDGFLLRLDKNYRQIWYKTYGGFSNDEFESVFIDGQGNILAGGTSTSFGVSIDTTSIVVNPCMYAVYVNEHGDLLWQKTYYGNPGSTNIKNNICKVLLLNNQNFALIGSSNNYLQNFNGKTYYIFNAFIQVINPQGDSIWHSNYNYFDTINPLPKNYIQYMGSNALIGPDGNITMLMVLLSQGEEYFPMSLIKVSPNSTRGYNRYISRHPVKGYWHNYLYELIAEKPFFPMQLVNQGSENYFVAAMNEMIVLSSGGTILKRVIISESSVIQDLQISDNHVFIAYGFNLKKTDLDGKVLWTSSSLENLNIDRVKGIFEEKDGSLSVFCSCRNATGEKDIALIRLRENGQFILN